MFLLVFNSNISKEGAYKGLMLWFNVLIPSIFPSMLASRMAHALNITNIINRYSYPVLKHLFNISKSSSYVIVFSFLCGIPASSVLAYEEYKNGNISMSEFEYLIIMTSNPSITFMINYVIAHVFENDTAGIIIVLSVYLATYVTGRIYYIKNRYQIYDRTTSKIINIKSLNNIFTDCLITISLVGIFVIIFSILCGNIMSFSGSVISVMLCGILEITTGLNIITSMSYSFVKILLAALITGFGGLCACFQIYSSLKDKHISLLFVIKQKMLSAAITLSIVISYLFIHRFRP